MARKFKHGDKVLIEARVEFYLNDGVYVLSLPRVLHYTVNDSGITMAAYESKHMVELIRDLDPSVTRKNPVNFQSTKKRRFLRRPSGILRKLSIFKFDRFSSE